jgi:hypothetical protein
MKEYEVKVVMEFWVTVEADTPEQAEAKGYLDYEEFLHTGTLYEVQAYEAAQDEEAEN